MYTPEITVRSTREVAHVPHIVTYVNKAIVNNPVRIGEPSDVFKFATKRIGAVDKSLRSEVVLRRGHARSYAIPGENGRQLPLYDSQGNVFLHEDIKGGGGVHSADSFTERHDGELEGVMEMRWARRDTKYSNLFSQWGVRTHRTIALARADHFYTEHEQSEFHKHPHREFALQYRAFRNNTRLSELVDVSNAECASLIRSAMQAITQHEGVSFESVQDYVIWLAKTLGKNLGIIHGKGYIHQYASLHNMTMAAEITDFDSVLYIKRRSGYSPHKPYDQVHVPGDDGSSQEEEAKWAMDALIEVEKAVNRTFHIQSNSAGQAFMGAYEQAFANTKSKNKPDL